MKIAVIICEYNPLQKGHVYHIRKTVEDCACDKVVCIMSGNFVQRGEAAIADKYTRAEWAVKNGADLVVELPPQYALTTAKYFALGAIKIANALDCEKVLSFGSEEGNMEKLKKAVEFEESKEFKTLFEKFISEGNGYATSYSLALKSFDKELALLLSSPNNTLAVEYLRAIRQTGSDLIPYTIKRIGAYDSEDLNGQFASASAIRRAVADGKTDCVKDYVPDDVFSFLSTLTRDITELTQDRLLAILKYTLSLDGASKAHGVKEGIENRICQHIKNAKTFSSLVSDIETKRYTRSYVRRTLLNIALFNSYTADDLISQEVDFVNALAVAEDSRELLSLFKCPVITKASRLSPDSLIAKSDSLYASLAGDFGKVMKVVKKLR